MRFGFGERLVEQALEALDYFVEVLVDKFRRRTLATLAAVDYRGRRRFGGCQALANRQLFLADFQCVVHVGLVRDRSGTVHGQLVPGPGISQHRRHAHRRRGGRPLLRNHEPRTAA